MIYNEEVLSQAAKGGSENVSLALSKLAQKKVTVNVSKIETMSIPETLERIRPKEEHAVVVYAQVKTGVPGVSIMTISREDALNLVDILSQQSIGTTGVLKDIDRSAIKEMLNILSNSYITALAKNTKTELELGVPNMITSDRLGSLLDTFKTNNQRTDNAIIFETVLGVDPYKIKATLYFIFDEHFAKIVKGEEV